MSQIFLQLMVMSMNTTVILGPEHMKEMSEIDTGFSEAELLSQLENGQKCIGIIHNDSIVAYMWMNFRELSYKATQISLKSNEAYLWNMYTRILPGKEPCTLPPV